jgi:hypothetical protein
MESKYGLLLLQRIFILTTCKFKLARLMEQGRKSRNFKLTKLWSVTCIELEEVLPLIISSQVVN